MLSAKALLVLGLLPAYVVGQAMTTTAKCLSSYSWMFNSVDQSPCDVGASLAAVCAPNGYFNLSPLPSGYIYLGPDTAYATPCRCSTVYYSLLSACGSCQGRNFIPWLSYSTNCSTVYSRNYPRDIPIGVRVQAWAYLDVETGNNFNVTQAQFASGIESTRAATATTFRTSSTYSALSTGFSSSGGGGGGSSVSVKGRRKKTPGIIGGVIGGLVVLLLLLVGALKLLSRNNKSKAAPQQPQVLPTQNTGPLNTPNTSIAPLNPQPTNTTSMYLDGSTPQPYYGMQQAPFTPSVMTQYTGASNQYTVSSHNMQPGQNFVPSMSPPPMQPGQNFAPPMSMSPPPPMQPGQNFAPPMSMSPPPPMQPGQNFAPPMSMSPQPPMQNFAPQNNMAYGNRSGVPEF